MDKQKEKKKKRNASVEDLLGLRRRMVEWGHTQRNLALYLGTNITVMNKTLNGYRGLSLAGLSRWHSALDVFDGWFRDGNDVTDMVVVRGERYGGV